MDRDEMGLDYLISFNRADQFMNDELVRIIQDAIEKAALSVLDENKGEPDGILYIHCDAVRILGERLVAHQVRLDLEWERADVLWKLLAVFNERLPRTKNVEMLRETGNQALRNLRGRVGLQRIPDVTGTLIFATTLYAKETKKIARAIDMLEVHFENGRLSTHDLRNTVRGLGFMIENGENVHLSIKAATLLIKLDKNAAEKAIKKLLDSGDGRLLIRERLKLKDIMDPGRRHLNAVPGEGPVPRSSFHGIRKKTHPAAENGRRPSSRPPMPTAEGVKKA